MKRLLEICCQSFDDVITAEAAGADRVEFCTDLKVGGLTPSLSEFIELKQIVKIPIYILIRSRPGNFIYTNLEIDQMAEQIRSFVQQGCEGVVFGGLDQKGDIDIKAVETWIKAAGDADMTFHRAIDSCEDQSQGIEELLQLGVNRILFSGRPTGGFNAETVYPLASRFPNMNIMACGGVRSTNLKEIMHPTITEYHSAAGSFDGDLFQQSVEEVGKLKTILS